MLEQMLGSETCSLINRQPVNGLIVDIGVSSGIDTLFYLKKGFKVIGVEADPVQFDLVRQFFSLIDPEKLTLLNRAAARRSGETLTIHRHQQFQALSGIEKRLDVPDNYQTFNVPTVGWSEIVSLAGVPRYLKIDIEGGELSFLEGMRDNGSLPEFISAEIYKFEVIQALIDIGYSRFVLVDQTPFQNNTYKLPAQQNEGLYTDSFTFIDSSGPFGRDIFTDDNWLSPEGVTAAWNDVRGLYWRTWFDCHAWRPNPL